jgi:hypothetical protein
MITAEITRKFIWIPKVLYKSNDHYITTKKILKWLSWEFVERRVAETGYTDYWVDVEQYLKYYNISTNKSIRYWCNESSDWVYHTDQWKITAPDTYTFTMTYTPIQPVAYIKVEYEITL